MTSADDGVVVDAVAGWARGEAGAAARRLAAIGELVQRRCPDDGEPDERGLWSFDCWDAVAAEVGAALGITARKASSQMYLARSLRERLPRLNAVFVAGRVSARLVATVSWRTHLVTDVAAMAAVDAGIAEVVQKWGVLSDAKVEEAIDALVSKHDPQAREWFSAAERGMDVQFGKQDDETGTQSMWGRLYSTHAQLIERRLTAMARAVCAADPRSIGQRRAEAMGAVFAGAQGIACQCGAPDCPQPRSDALAGSVVIHVVADQTAVAAATRNTVGPRNTAGDPTRSPAVAVMTVGGVLPPALLQALLRDGAKLAPLTIPDGVSDGYRPSVAQARFVRCRDMTCRFPGCHAPAEYCDIDHAIPYPLGPTHPSNLRCLCRKHHLLKTFWVGEDGWSDIQQPDGTIVWTGPTGRTYTTYPGSRVFFPDWDVRTAALPPIRPDTPRPENRSLRMPRRARTRAKDNAQRIKNRRARQDTS